MKLPFKLLFPSSSTYSQHPIVTARDINLTMPNLLYNSVFQWPDKKNQAFCAQNQKKIIFIAFELFKNGWMDGYRNDAYKWVEVCIECIYKWSKLSFLYTLCMVNQEGYILMLSSHPMSEDCLLMLMLPPLEHKSWCMDICFVSINKHKCLTLGRQGLSRILYR